MRVDMNERRYYQCPSCLATVQGWTNARAFEDWHEPWCPEVEKSWHERTPAREISEEEATT